MEQAQIQIIGNNNDLKNDVEIILSDEKIGSTTVNKKINRKFFGKIIIKLRAATFFLPKRKDRIDRVLKQQQKQQSTTSTMSPGVVYDKKSAEDATIQNDDKIPSKSLPTTTTTTATTTATTTTAILTTTPKTTNKNVVDNDSTTMTVDTIQKSAKQHQEEVEKEKEEIVKAPISELMKPFLNLDTQETLTPSNVNASTCPNCHTPDSVYDVKNNDNADLNSAKNGFICLSHTSYGCGWEGNHKPNEDDVAKNVFSTLGFKPLILN